MLIASYTPTASVTNVNNPVTAGQDATTGNVPTSIIFNPDDYTGSNTIATANESQSLVVSGTSVNGRFDNFTVINNPA